MTNAEAVEEKIDKLKSNIANCCKECFREGYRQGQTNEEYFDDGLDGDIYFAINDIFSDAIAALSPKPLEFPSWEEFKKVGYVQIERKQFWVNVCSNSKKYIFIEIGISHFVIKQEEFDFTEAGYNMAIVQLNAWVDELIAELRGIE